MFSGGDRIAKRRVHHHDAALRGGGNVDVVHADAGAADHLEVRRGGDDLRRHLGGGADGEAIVVGDDGKQRILVLAEIGEVIHLHATVAENLHGGFGKLVGYENAGSH